MAATGKRSLDAAVAALAGTQRERLGLLLQRTQATILHRAEHRWSVNSIGSGLYTNSNYPAFSTGIPNGERAIDRPQPHHTLEHSRQHGLAWLAATLTFFVIAELLIAPLGLSLLLRNTPSRFVGVVTGLWFGAAALGYWLGGEIGALWTRWPSIHVLLLLTAMPAAGATRLFAGARRTESDRAVCSVPAGAWE